MSSKKTVAAKPKAVAARERDELKGTLKRVGGSKSDHWNDTLAHQAIHALWKKSDEKQYDRQLNATIAALAGIGPKDELEGMMAAQLIAAHNAAMECYRREHVHVHQGGQAIIGNVEGGGECTKLEDQPHALEHTPGEALRSQDTEREALPVACDAERPLPDARRTVARPSQGK